ncbi:atrophin-1 isoform X1 [Synchiropus splendidus]|uniref:atrophin-1 isoform X1 n=1 Tax=Synchiropus splendidus TaxID=270530 RepID=UPI00237D6DAB|nr:atrophin-1 isoform X1 [Synchiropus splendidus]XP_053706059.1 atrophin-1 isoform X1 [Synchiropus splendidus]
MEVKGQLISAPEPLTCSSRKQRERMTELQERRRSLQMLLSMRLAELRRICLKEAELTGTMPNEFPLEVGEKPPRVTRRVGASCPGNKKSRAQQDEGQRPKPKKSLFSGVLRKSGDPEHTANAHTHQGKKTEHRGCHTGDTHTSRSQLDTNDASFSRSDDFGSQGHSPGTAGSPVEVFFHNKRRNSLLRTSPPENTSRPLTLPPSQPPPPPPRRTQDSSSSNSDPDPARWTVPAGARVATVTGGSPTVTGKEGAEPVQRGGGARVVKGTEGESVMGGRARDCHGGGVQLDFWAKRRQPITMQQKLLYNGYSAQQPAGAPATHSRLGDQRKSTVTRTRSCGPFQSETHSPPLLAIQPDPHPHLLPPRPPQPPTLEASPGDTTRTLHKALALEGLRDWYLRNTSGSSNSAGSAHSSSGSSAHYRQSNPPVGAGHHRPKLPHSFTFHGRLACSSLNQDSSPHKQKIPSLDPEPLSPGTLV